jgi:DNA-binding MarR family transcriptional regulator
MDEERQVELIQQVVGASHVFSSAMTELVETALEEASDRQVSMSQVKLLLLISRPGQRLKVMDVAAFLGVTNAAASRSIDRLVQQGLVDRRPTPEDRRAVDLSLTRKGKHLLGRFTELRNREFLKHFRHHAPEELELVSTLLDKLSVSLLDPPPDRGDRCLRCGIHFRGNCFLRDVLGVDCLAGSVAPGSGGEPATPAG